MPATFTRIITISPLPLQIPADYPDARTRLLENRAEDIINNYPLALKKLDRIPERYHSKIDVLVRILDRNI